MLPVRREGQQPSLPVCVLGLVGVEGCCFLHTYLIEKLLQEKSKLLNQKKPEQCSGGCEAAKTLHLQLKEALSKLEEEKTKTHEAENRAQEAVRETSSLEKALLEKTQEEGEKRALEEQIENMSFKTAKLEEELEASKKTFQDLKEQVGVQQQYSFVL